MARVFVQRPSGSFVEARYADVTLPSVTLHEAIAARRALLAKGRREIDMRSIVHTAVAQRELVDAAAKQTATARRSKAGGVKSKVDDGSWGSLRGVDSSKPVVGSTGQRNGLLQHIGRRSEAKGFSRSGVKLEGNGIQVILAVSR